MPWDKHRPDTAHHYRGPYRRLRERLMAGNPDCAICGERPARIADHRTPICEGGPTTAENLQAICQPCSLTKTGKEGAAMRAAKRRARQRKALKA
ncbi:HNH endonuclease signature motif containing protein [Croceicoccus marinus]|uniref:HNH endonuclease n=1 Tax=Croceicoccus marinus TaxID=450378 RepID=A0A7G6VUJ9_9SPHN|nr:HNH endonuclease signature motif containing protein [Croceicoccus marinus]QNE05414.1 HNH endonuclease [Croceicoccus marinus]